MKRYGLLFLSMMMMGSFSFGLNKGKFKNHLRMALNESDMKIDVGDPVESEFEGFLEVPVTVQGQKQTVFMRKDEKKYIWGMLFDMDVNYDKERMDGISMKKAFSKGSKKAPVTVVEYSDLQCGYCRKAHLAFEEELYKMYSKDQVRWVYKHFPLRNHKWAKDGAVAATCAGEQDKDAFWDMMHRLFTDSKKIKLETLEETVKAHVKDMKLNEKKFQACLEGEKASERVQADYEEGVRVGVRSTPTFFINGRKKRGFRNMEAFKSVIDAKLKAAEKK